MLHPSYTDLMEKVNERHEEEGVSIRSRYSIIIATSKRARQIVEEGTASKEKPLSIAVKELYRGEIDIEKQ